MIYIVISLIGGIVCAAMAPGMRRSAFGWFVIGALVPVVGFILLLVLPPVPDPYADTANTVPEPGPMQMPHAAPPPQQSAQAQSIDSLHKLVELKERGALTASEFEESKRQLLQNL